MIAPVNEYASMPKLEEIIVVIRRMDVSDNGEKVSKTGAGYQTDGVIAQDIERGRLWKCDEKFPD